MNIEINEYMIKWQTREREYVCEKECVWVCERMCNEREKEGEGDREREIGSMGQRERERERESSCERERARGRESKGEKRENELRAIERKHGRIGDEVDI
jgi:hypothetical protein